MDQLSIEQAKSMRELRNKGYTPEQVALMLSIDVGDVRLLLDAYTRHKRKTNAKNKVRETQEKTANALDRPYAKKVQRELQKRMHHAPVKHQPLKRFRFTGWNASDSREIWSEIDTFRHKLDIIFTNFNIREDEQQRVHRVLERESAA